MKFTHGSPPEIRALDGRRSNHKITDWDSLISMGMMSPKVRETRWQCLTRRSQEALISIMTGEIERIAEDL